MTRPTRRAVLAAPLTLMAVACTEKGSSRRHEPNPDAGLLRQAQDRERSLIEAYDAVLAQAPADPVLAEVREEHLAHLRALGGHPDTTTAAPLSGVPRAGAIRAGLDSAEQAAVTAGQAAAAVARSGATAQLLASIAASEASHVVVVAGRPVTHR